MCALFTRPIAEEDFGFNMVSDGSESMLARIGSLIAPLFAPMGFGDWRASTALVTGLLAKETVVSTFTVLLGVGKDALPAALSSMYTPLAAFSMACFCLLYMPCVAALSAARRELGSFKSAMLAALYQTGTAWIVSFLVYNTGLLLGLG
jgi:ferrous iron transport protein B